MKQKAIRISALLLALLMILLAVTACDMDGLQINVNMNGDVNGTINGGVSGSIGGDALPGGTVNIGGGATTEATETTASGNVTDADSDSMESARPAEGSSDAESTRPAEGSSDAESTGGAGASTGGSGGSTESGGTNTMGVPLQPDETLEVPRINYGGIEIRILQKSTTVDEMYAARLAGELVNDAVYNRNKFVENYLNVKLSYDSAPVSVADYAAFKAKVDCAVSSGYDQYHIISNYTYNAPTLIAEGAFLNINGISEENNMIDLDKRWWNQSFHENAEIAGKLYMLCGDITTSIIDAAEVVFYNDEMVSWYVGNDYDILQKVYEREWTYEEFLRLIHLVGDGASTGEWGYTAQNNSNSLDGMLMGMAANLTERDLHDNPVVYLDTVRNVEIGNRLRALYQNDSSAKCVDSSSASIPFCEGNAMFYMGPLESSGGVLRASGQAYGIVPPPLFDENQEEYRIVPQDSASSLSLLCHVDVMLPAVTRTLEVMGSESYLNLRHCIQWKCYQQRYLKTEPKGRMFDFVVDNIYYDFGYTYSKVMNSPYQLIRNYARYPAGSGSYYIESLPSELAPAERLSWTNLVAFVERIYNMPQ